MRKSLLLLPLFIAPWLAAGAETGPRVTVRAGDFERRNTVVTFALPSGAKAYDALIGADGQTTALQADGGHASFIETHLAKGASKTYRLAQDLKASPPAAVTATREGTRLKLESGGEPVLFYQAEPGEFPRENIKSLFRRGGYIHPVHSPSGLAVTDDFPPNHVHHHGIWFPWTKTVFEGRTPDFWNMGEGKGKVEFAALEQSWSGPVHAGFRARHRFMDLTAPEPKAALQETWEVKVYRGETGARPYWLFDLVSTQQCESSNPLKLPEYHYGGLGFRGNWEWNGKDNAHFLTSEGETDRVKGNTARARWCHVGGTVGGQLTGIAILGHPDNFRAPQPMRLHPTEPFFCFAPSQLGDWEISPGQAYVSRYRFAVQDGPPDKELIERLWNDYAHPPSVKVEGE
jgi:hypothetical protein